MLKIYGTLLYNFHSCTVLLIEFNIKKTLKKRKITVYFLSVSLWWHSKLREFEIKDHLIGNFNQSFSEWKHKHFTSLYCMAYILTVLVFQPVWMCYIIILFSDFFLSPDHKGLTLLKFHSHSFARVIFDYIT